MDFRARNISRDKEVYFIKMKELAHQKDLTTHGIYASNNSSESVRKIDANARTNR